MLQKGITIARARPIRLPLRPPRCGGFVLDCRLVAAAEQAGEFARRLLDDADEARPRVWTAQPERRAETLHLVCSISDDFDERVWLVADEEALALGCCLQRLARGLPAPYGAAVGGKRADIEHGEQPEAMELGGKPVPFVEAVPGQAFGRLGDLRRDGGPDGGLNWPGRRGSPSKA